MQKDRVESNMLRHVAYEEMFKGTGKQVEVTVLGGRLTFFGPFLLLINFSALMKIRESEKEEHYAYVLINISQFFSISQD